MPTKGERTKLKPVNKKKTAAAAAATTDSAAVVAASKHIQLLEKDILQVFS